MPNFICSILRKGGTKIYIKDLGLIKMAAIPIYIKILKKYFIFLWNRWTDFNSLRDTGPPIYVKILKKYFSREPMDRFQ